jgi:malonate decarboxylase beta subunit
LLAARLHALPADTAGNAGQDEATLLWSALGVTDAQRVPELGVDAVRALRTIKLRNI